MCRVMLTFVAILTCLVTRELASNRSATVPDIESAEIGCILHYRQQSCGDRRNTCNQSRDVGELLACASCHLAGEGHGYRYPGRVEGLSENSMDVFLDYNIFIAPI